MRPKAHNIICASNWKLPVGNAPCLAKSLEKSLSVETGSGIVQMRPRHKLEAAYMKCAQGEILASVEN